MSSFERHPRRSVYEETAKEMPPKNALEYFDALRRQSLGLKVRIPRALYLSPQNRRVRFAADLALARQVEFPNRVTRQQRRFRARKEAA